MSREQRIYFDPSPDEAQTFAGKKKSPVASYASKVGKLIPGEVVAGYQAAMGLATGVPDQGRQWIYWACSLVGLVVTVVYIAGAMTKLQRKKHLFVYGLAFVVWAYGLSGNKLVPEGWWTHESTRGVVLVLGSMLLGCFKLPKLPKLNP